MIKLIPKLVKRLTEEQLNVLKKSVKEKREVPIRIVYTQKYWDEIVKDPSFCLGAREFQALKRSIPEIAKILNNKKANIIHLGIGNGREIPVLVNALKIKNIDVYSMIDINKTMLDISEAKTKKQCAGLKIKKFCKDIETYGIKDIYQQTKKAGAKINLIVLTGNAVLFSNDELVKDIVKNMDEKDCFLLSLELYQKGKDEEIIKSYLIPSIFDLLANGLKILGHKIKYKYFDAEIDQKKHWLKVYFSPNGDRKKKLLVLHSYKPNIKELTRRMNKFGFKTLLINEHKDIHICIALYKKK